MTTFFVLLIITIAGIIILNISRINTEKQQAIAHIENLILLAHSDGAIQQLEIDGIALIAKRYRISPNQYDTINRNVITTKLSENNIKQQLNSFKPKNKDTRAKYLNDMINIMLIDGTQNRIEQDLCILIANSFGVDDLVVFLQIAQTKNNMSGKTITDSKGNELTYSF